MFHLYIYFRPTKSKFLLHFCSLFIFFCNCYAFNNALLNIHLTGTIPSIARTVTWCGPKVLREAYLFKFQEEISCKKSEVVVMESSILHTSSSMGGSHEGNQISECRRFQTLVSHPPRYVVLIPALYCIYYELFLKSNSFCKLGFGQGPDL